MSQQTYKVTPQRQLVDLNGDSKNFDLTFTCTSKNNANFDVLVVDQTTLDSTPNLQYKKATGTISGNIVADKDIYQNYFLVLRSDTTCDVTVKTVKKDIPANVPHVSPRAIPQSSIQQPNKPPPQKSGTSKWKIIALVVVIIGGGSLLYYFYNQKQKTKSSSIGAEASPPASPAVEPPPTTSPTVETGGLLDRLRNLPIK